MNISFQSRKSITLCHDSAVVTFSTSLCTLWSYAFCWTYYFCLPYNSKRLNKYSAKHFQRCSSANRCKGAQLFCWAPHWEIPAHWESQPKGDLGHETQRIHWGGHSDCSHRHADTHIWWRFFSIEGHGYDGVCCNAPQMLIANPAIHDKKNELSLLDTEWSVTIRIRVKLA